MVRQKTASLRFYYTARYKKQSVYGLSDMYASSESKIIVYKAQYKANPMTVKYFNEDGTPLSLKRLTMARMRSTAQGGKPSG
jgi:hypothetical protein